MPAKTRKPATSRKAAKPKRKRTPAPRMRMRRQKLPPQPPTEVPDIGLLDSDDDPVPE